MRWVPGVSIGEEGGKFWPWHRERDEWFTIGHHRIGAAVVIVCRDCGTVLAAPVGAKGRKAAAVSQHDALHQQLSEMQEQIAHLHEFLGIEIGDQDDGTDTQSTESGYIEPGYDVRETGTAPANDDDG